MSYTKTSDGRYRMDVHIHDGRGGRIMRTFNTAAEARTVEHEIRSRLQRGDFINPRLVPKFREDAAAYFAGKANRSPGTVANYRVHIQRHLRPARSAVWGAGSSAISVWIRST